MIQTQEVYHPMYTDKDKFIVLITGGRGCETPTQEVIMADLTIKQIKDIRVGDLVMGIDGTPRKVLDVHSGHSLMYRVQQSNGDDYFVNEEHILALRKSKSAATDKGRLLKNGKYQSKHGRYPQYGRDINMPIAEYLSHSKRFRYHFRGFKAGAIPYKAQPVQIEPYMLGLWLGDGTSIFPRITNPDVEVRKWLQDYCKRNGQRYYEKWSKGAAHIGIVADRRKDGNAFMNALRYYDIVGNKHIPQEYISNTDTVRLELLAGLIDTDGSFDGWNYEISQKSECLAKQIKYIADTLGFRTSLHTKKAKIGEKDCRVYYRISISGDISRIPCKVVRKQVRQDCYCHRTFLESSLTITEAGIGDWVGIELDGDKRYIHSDGTVTHNSGKSYNASTFVERLTFELSKVIADDGEVRKLVHTILYTRYTMTSASISVIPEFLEKIEADGTQQYFRATRTDVTNVMTGSQIMFRGIKTSSGNQTAKLKSIHGITTFVCDEAEEWTSEREFDTIMLSIRQKGIQNRVIIIMNPTDSNHFIYQKYIKDTHKLVEYDGVPVQISTHPNVLHIHTTYLNNTEHLSEEFVREVQQMKENNPEKYAHVVMGRWADVAEGAVFKKWGIVDEFPRECKHIARGLDFGYSNDPSACVKVGILNNDLYVDEQFYRTGMSSAELIAELKKDNAFVYSESADPRLIDEISMSGVIIYPVDKSGQSILAGIEGIKDYDNLFITKRSYNVQDELRNYTWDKDKDGNYINQPIDRYNHAIDALRYWYLGKILGKVLRKKETATTKNNINNFGVF